MSDSIMTITGKVKLRTPTQADSLSSRYTFLNLQNAEPNLGIPKSPGVKNEYPGDPGYRYLLLSNNNTNSLSSWRVWSYDNPRIVAYSKENSIALGNNANPINTDSIVYSNYTYSTNNVYNSQSFNDFSFNIFSLSGIYLFDATTVGDPASATAFIVTEDGKVGVNTDSPGETFTVVGNISGVGNLFISNNANLGDTKTDVHTVRGTLRVGDSFTSPMLFGSGNTNYDTNLYRLSTNNLHTEGKFSCVSLSARNTGTFSTVILTNANVTTLPTATASGDFLVININGANRAIRLWDF